ncbi:MAG TPA: methylmalonyl-CoA mutase family protein, partial [Acidimicrobiia bacterium]|nr:methylmalonyl-CoA mutase family protein [Acidimicrobiia bacterium]
FAELWDEITRDRYGVTDEKLRRFRYGVQVNSLGLTEAQPENNIQRIVLEMLGVTLSKSARARAVQLPAWNEALGLPRPWDQQWSLRMQQVLAFETDLLEYGDIFDGSTVIEGKTASLEEAATAELEWVLDGGGAFAMIDELKGRLVQSHSERTRRIESGDITVVGVNAYTTTEPSPLEEADEGAILVVDPAVEAQLVDELGRWKAGRDAGVVDRALDRLRETASGTDNIMEATIALAEAGGTVGEWAGALREVFGEFRAPTGVGGVVVSSDAEAMTAVRETVRAITANGGPPKLLVGKPGLDGHSNGAEQIAVAARDAGMEVIYSGIRLTPAQIAQSAADEDVDIVGLSILSGSHLELVPETVRLLREAGVTAPVVVGGIIPPSDQAKLAEIGVARVYTPKDFRLTQVMAEIADLVLAERNGSGEQR